MIMGGLAHASPAAAEPPVPAHATPGSAASSTIAPQIVTAVRIRTRTVVVEGLRCTVPTLTVRGPIPKIARSIEAMVAAQVRVGLDGYTALHQPSEPDWGAYEIKARVVANTSPVLSIVLEEYRRTQNHGHTSYWQITVDTRTGRRWTTPAIASTVQRATRPGVDLITEIRRDLGTDGPTGPIGLDEVTLAPTRAGLYVLLDQCTIVCVAGPVAWRLPWQRLLRPGTRLPFAPW